MKGTLINKQEIISVISSISESLSVSDKHEFIVETALDSLSESLDIHCSWIQLSGQSGTNPYLASHRNFTEDILHDMTHMNKDHPLFREVLGLGNRIVIPNLCMDGAYGMSVFEKAGFCSLVAVPITTYKVLGILGAADEKKRRFSNDIAQLLSVIASLVGVSLTKTNIMQKVLPERFELPGEPEPDIDMNIKPDMADDTVTEREPGHPVDNETFANREPSYRIGNNIITNREPSYRIGNDIITNREACRHTVRTTNEKTDAFSKHARKMTRFRQQHN